MIKRLPWLRRLKKTDIEPPLRLPIAAGPLTNGEGWWPDNKRKQLIRKLVNEKAEEISRKHGVDRREFMASSCGMATTLFVMNMVNGCSSGGKKVMSMPSGGSGGTGTNMDSVTGMMAGNSTPSGSMPSGSMPSGSMPGGAMPGGAMPGGAMPSGGMPGGSMPGGAMPSGGMPGGVPGAPITGQMPSMGSMRVDELACWDPAAADALLSMGDTIVIDMQSHFATPETNPIGALGLDAFVGQINNQRYPWIVRSPGVSSSGKYDRNEYINQILMGSPTTIGVLSGISYSVGPSGTGTSGFAALSNEDLLGGADFLAGKYPGRVLKHCMVMPNDRIDVQLAMMERNASSYHNWKTYPPYQGGAGTGYWLNEGVGPMMIQKGIELGLPIFCIHKGFPLSGFSAMHSSPRDVGPAARMFPDAYLVIYHSAFENGLAAGESSAPAERFLGMECGAGNLPPGKWPEGPYDEDDAMIQSMYPLDRGVNSLIKSLRDSNIGPNGRDLDDPEGEEKTFVYAECGGVWPNLMTSRQDEAMHFWGKLLKHVGEDRLVWGTDCLWFGSPTPLIQAFKCFEITEEFQQKYGYPALTPLRKAKILGLNAARLQNTHPDVNIDLNACHSDIVGMAHMQLKRELDEEFGPRRDMMFDVWGPKTRREFFQLVRHESREKAYWSGNVPAVKATNKRA